uniref:C-C motif chemokine n=1 Tax=Chelydra serpentina TaxID=8475 RepID=A0A8C3S1I9_CHESE
MKVCVAAFAVLLIAALCSQVHSQLGKSYGVNTPTSCCFSHVPKQIPRSLVVKYRHTNSKCSLPAVIFTTKKGREVCSDPNAQWVQEYVNCWPPTRKPSEVLRTNGWEEPQVWNPGWVAPR